jgi:magnesium-transporting ATPase (P-type)
MKRRMMMRMMMMMMPVVQVRGEVEATVEYTGKNTFFGKTASLLNASSELSNLEKLLIRYADGRNDHGS